MAIRHFPYRRFSLPPCNAFPNGQKLAFPLIRVALTRDNARLSCFGLIDSGSNHCVFPASFAKWLGLDLLKAKLSYTGGFGGSCVPTYYQDLRIEVEGAPQLNLYVGFTEGLNSLGFGLLGHLGFLDTYNVELRARENRVSIHFDEPPSEPAGR